MTTTIYVPGTDETDPKKQNMSLQQIGPKLSTAIDNIATNTASIAALQALASPLTNSLGADVSLNNIANYFTGPTVAQGSTGTWWASGIVTFLDTTSADTFYAKLWDGTTVIASGAVTTGGANFLASISLSGYLASPAGNIRISCRAPNATTGKIVFNATGNSKDATVSAYRIA